MDFEEFLIGIAVCCRGTKSDRMYVLFQVFDLNNDGFIQKSELVAMLSNLPNLQNYLLHNNNSSHRLAPSAARKLGSRARGASLPDGDSAASPSHSPPSSEDERRKTTSGLSQRHPPTPPLASRLKTEKPLPPSGEGDAAGPSSQPSRSFNFAEKGLGDKGVASRESPSPRLPVPPGGDGSAAATEGALKERLCEGQGDPVSFDQLRECGASCASSSSVPFLRDSAGAGASQSLRSESSSDVSSFSDFFPCFTPAGILAGSREASPSSRENGAAEAAAVVVSSSEAAFAVTSANSSGEPLTGGVGASASSALSRVPSDSSFAGERRVAASSAAQPPSPPLPSLALLPSASSEPASHGGEGGSLQQLQQPHQSNLLEAPAAAGLCASAKKNPSPVAQELIDLDKEQQQATDLKTSLDVEDVVDRIIEECEVRQELR